MRRTAAAIIAAALLLAGCSGSGDSDSTATASASATMSAEEAQAALDTVSVTGDPGTEPEITAAWPFEIGIDAAKVLNAGDGAQITDGQLISMHLRAVSGVDGADQGGTYSGEPESYWLSNTATASLPDALTNAIVGQQVGARVLFAGPRTLDSGDAATLIWVVDVTATQDVLDTASGTDVTPADGLPTVTMSDSGEPSITTVDGDAPTELVVQPLITGTGAQVTSSSLIVANYSGWLWDGTAFDSSWSNGSPIDFTPTDVIEGWGEGLVGQTVGSRLLLIIPPDLGYGDEDSGSIPGGSTLIFVVDILAAS